MIRIAALFVFLLANVAPLATASEPTQVLDFKMQRLGGPEQELAEYRGEVVLIVNVASKCGLTPQYTGLQKLYDTYRERGFTILGFPSNDFAGQEPGSDAEIRAFCEKNYGVTFPMFSKIRVRGDQKHPLYARLTAQPAPVGGEVAWNFQKYLVDRQGNVVARFEPRTDPQDAKLIERIEALLAEQKTAALSR